MISFKRTAALVAAFAVAVLSLPIPQSGDEKEVFDVLPAEFQKFIESLTPDDVKTFGSLIENVDNLNDDEKIYDEIRKQNPALADRVKTLFSALDAKFDALSPVPKKFLSGLMSAIVSFDEKKIDNVEKEAKSLPQEARDEIIKTFPSFKELFDFTDK
ncbi:hypothetical protein L596_023299 [Steinernema carpocapsae]|uniref:Fatty-acid and retinol-binding protein 1 n=1 Tax=Steinernema carpocapsae TaxID=34508 RepID=A0A4U5MD88_STECR|nr:hypothetical protein L596_023299 [Steinernema carpocapsae]